MSFLSIVASFGFLVDFVSSILKIYNIFVNDSANQIVNIILLILSAILSIVSAFCFVMISLTYKDKNRYDYKKIGILNLTPPMWFAIKAFIGLIDSIGTGEMSVLMTYISVAFGLVTYLNVAYEFRRKNCTEKTKIFLLRTFSSLSSLSFVFSIVDLVKKNMEFLDYHFLLSLSLFMIGIFAHFLSVEFIKNKKNI